MTSLLAVRDELVELYLKPRSPGVVSLAAATRSRRANRMMALAPSVRMGPDAQPLRPRVHAVGIGEKRGEPAVIVYVTRKVPRDLLPKDVVVPAAVDGVKTDVVESPLPRLCTAPKVDPQGRVRPLMGGISIGRADGPSGTLGAFVRSTRASDPKDALLLLSNSHILAPESGRVAGTEIVQPSADDSRGEQEVIAKVVRATKLHRTVPIEADAAVAEILDGVAVENAVCDVGKLTGVADPITDMKVIKHGRTSGRTEGKISVTGLTSQIADREHGIELTFLNLFRVERLHGDDEAIGEGGDSGSIVVETGSRQAVGLLSAADDLGTFYLAHPIRQVLKELDLRLELE